MPSNDSRATVTRAERMELARAATVQITGLSEELLRMVREQEIASMAPKYHAALGMLATINDLSEDIFSLIFGDPDDEFTREQADCIMRKLGLDTIDADRFAEEVAHG